jgi:hypothetical protein
VGSSVRKQDTEEEDNKKLPKFQIGISRKQQPTTVVLSTLNNTQRKKQKSSHLSPFFDQPTD